MASYTATIPVEFPHPAHVVYEALCDLGRYPQWNTGMKSISRTGRMQPGLRYTTVSDVLGRSNEAHIEVMQMIPDKAIALESSTGLIKFRAVFELAELAPNRCSVMCNLRFEFSHLIFNLAQPLVEAITENRIRGDLETLRASL